MSPQIDVSLRFRDGIFPKAGSVGSSVYVDLADEYDKEITLWFARDDAVEQIDALIAALEEAKALVSE